MIRRYLSGDHFTSNRVAISPFTFYQRRERFNADNREEKRDQVGTGDRSEKIRTYNFPQDRVTDHRVNESWHGLPKIMSGGLEPIIESLQGFNGDWSHGDKD